MLYVAQNTRKNLDTDITDTYLSNNRQEHTYLSNNGCK